MITDEKAAEIREELAKPPAGRVATFEEVEACLADQYYGPPDPWAREVPLPAAEAVAYLLELVALERNAAQVQLLEAERMRIAAEAVEKIPAAASWRRHKAKEALDACERHRARIEALELAIESLGVEQPVTVDFSAEPYASDRALAVALRQLDAGRSPTQAEQAMLDAAGAIDRLHRIIARVTRRPAERAPAKLAPIAAEASGELYPCPAPRSL